MKYPKSHQHPILCRSVMGLIISLPLNAQSQIIDFHFTGNLLVADVYNSIIYNNDEYGNPQALTPIAASLEYNTQSGIGGSNLSIQMSGGFWNTPATFHDISLEHDTGTNTIRGNILVDWNGSYNMPMHINWDATGFLNAIDYGLEVGDTISGSTLKRDTNNDGVFDQFTNVYSQSPYSDTLLAEAGLGVVEGPAPLAATSASLGLGYDIYGNYVGGTPFDGIRGLINIGSGNSLTVTSVSTVPVPAAAWLFGSGLLGLIGMARRRMA